MEQILREKGEVKRRREIGGGERGEKGGERRGKEKEERGSGGESGERRTRRERERESLHNCNQNNHHSALAKLQNPYNSQATKNSPQRKLVSLP